jgi:2-amino-4-hydroxy-6-hydroxymethyldihydropteridine diphosphokinase
LLAFGTEMINDEDLIVPHPRLATRAFVLVPWADIAPDFQVPGLATVGKLLAVCLGRDQLTAIGAD